MLQRRMGIVAGLTLLLSLPAAAADLRPVYKAPPAPAATYSWTGWYVGLNAGYHWSDNAINSSSIAGPCSPLFAGCAPGVSPNYSELAAIGATGSVGGDIDGFAGGLQIGYNWQIQNWVLGFEADFQWMANSDGGGAFNSSVTTPAFVAFPITTQFQGSRSLDWLGTVRGRAGFLATPAALVYVTGGLAYGEANLSGTYNQACVGCAGPVIGLSGAVNASDVLVGWTLGGGVEWLLAPNWTVKAEYLYYDLGSLSASTTIPGTVTGAGGAPFMRHSPTIESRFDGHIVRAGLNYKFDWGKGPVMARY